MSDDSNLKLLALNKYFFYNQMQIYEEVNLVKGIWIFFLTVNVSSMVETLAHYVNNGDLKENPP